MGTAECSLNPKFQIGSGSTPPVDRCVPRAKQQRDEPQHALFGQLSCVGLHGGLPTRLLCRSFPQQRRSINGVYAHLSVCECNHID